MTDLEHIDDLLSGISPDLTNDVLTFLSRSNLSMDQKKYLIDVINRAFSEGVLIETDGMLKKEIQADMDDFNTKFKELLTAQPKCQLDPKDCLMCVASPENLCEICGKSLS